MTKIVYLELFENSDIIYQILFIRYYLSDIIYRHFTLVNCKLGDHVNTKDAFNWDAIDVTCILMAHAIVFIGGNAITTRVGRSW